jgi:hypothetical protein
MSLIDSPVAVPVSRLFPLQDMSAGEIAARIAARDIPAAEIVEHFIARLKAVNTRLNAVTVELFDSARKTAAKSTTRCCAARSLLRWPVCRSPSRNASISPAPHRRSDCRRAAR